MMVECIIDENDPFYERLKKGPMTIDVINKRKTLHNLYDIQVLISKQSI